MTGGRRWCYTPKRTVLRTAANPFVRKISRLEPRPGFPRSIGSEANQHKIKWLTTNIISMALSEEHAIVWYFHRKDVLGRLRLEMFL